MRLYDITHEWAEIADLIDEADGEVTPEIEERLCAVEGALDEKVDSICSLLREWKATADVIREEERRLKKRRDSLDSRTARLREYLGTCLDMAGCQRVKSARFTVSLSQSRGAVSVTDLEALPDAFKVQKVDVDRRALRAALDAGEEVPGARVEPGSTTVTIR